MGVTLIVTVGIGLLGFAEGKALCVLFICIVSLLDDEVSIILHVTKGYIVRDLHVVELSLHGLELILGSVHVSSGSNLGSLEALKVTIAVFKSLIIASLETIHVSYKSIQFKDISSFQISEGKILHLTWELLK